MVYQDEESSRWKSLENISPIITPYLVLALEDLDHIKAQHILNNEDKRINSIGSDTFVYKSIAIEKDQRDLPCCSKSARI